MAPRHAAWRTIGLGLLLAAGLGLAGCEPRPPAKPPTPKTGAVDGAVPVRLPPAA
jgi:hypothetical protein